MKTVKSSFPLKKYCSSLCVFILLVFSSSMFAHENTNNRDDYKLNVDTNPYRIESSNPLEDSSKSNALPCSAPTKTPDFFEHSLQNLPFQAEIFNIASKFHVDPLLVHSIIRVESAYQTNAQSPKGAIGLMQVMPATAARFGFDRDIQAVHVNLTAGIRYLCWLMMTFDYQLPLVLAAYNAGEGSVYRYGRKIPPFRETEDYVEKVIGHYVDLLASSVKKSDANGSEPLAIYKLMQQRVSLEKHDIQQHALKEAISDAKFRPSIPEKKSRPMLSIPFKEDTSTPPSSNRKQLSTTHYLSGTRLFE